MLTSYPETVCGSESYATVQDHIFALSFYKSEINSPFPYTLVSDSQSLTPNLLMNEKCHFYEYSGVNREE